MTAKLGKVYKDSISGFEGIAVSRSTYLYGCVRILLTPTKLKPDGDFLPDCWFDEPQLDAVAASKTIKKKRTSATGGPTRSVAPSRDPI